MNMLLFLSLPSSCKQQRQPCSRHLFAVLIYFWTSLSLSMAEIRDLDLLLKADDAYIYFTDGYLRAPGYIDINSLVFQTIGESFIDDQPADTTTTSTTTNNPDMNNMNGNDSMNMSGNDSMNMNGNDSMDMNGNDSMNMNGSDSGPPRRILKQFAGVRHKIGPRRQLQDSMDDGTNSNNNIPAGSGGDNDKQDQQPSVNFTKYALDVVVFQQPDQCSKRGNCDWTTLGVGAKTTEGTLRWCCSNDALDLGLCTQAQLGRLILNDATFVGKKRAIFVPPTGNMKTQLQYAKFEETISGRYVVIFSNCNAMGRDVKVSGSSIWKSIHGYLPGELFGFMYFYFAMTAVFALLTVWFGYLMKRNKESRIPIEKWIFTTMSLGLLEMFLRSTDYLVWNVYGDHPMVLVYSAIIVGVLKCGISRGIMVMVALGWGVIRDSLGPTMSSIIILTSCYIGVSALRDFMAVFAIEDIRTLSYKQEEELIDIVAILTFVVASIDVVFVLWILDGLNGTMQYLESRNQLRKLARFLRLRSILLFAILFATIWVVFSLVDNYDEDGIVREEHEWIIDAATEINYLYLVVGIAILWRPNPMAREYAYVMELSGDDGNEDDVFEDEHDLRQNGQQHTTELELAGHVPSALDDHHNKGGSNPDPKGYHDERFAIDEGEGA